MEISAEDYQLIKSHQQYDGYKLIERIVKENKNRHFDVIIDIGCGSGNVTIQLANRVKYNRIVAFDIDPNMIKYAKEHHQSPKINYIVNDIEAPFEKMSDEIRQLKGKTSLIFSNRALHWIEVRENAIENISKLLSSNGMIYANITIIGEILKLMKPEELIRFKSIFNLPSNEEEVQQWKKAFANGGLSIIDDQYNYNSYTNLPLTQTVAENVQVNAVINFLIKRYLIEKDESIRNCIIKSSDGDFLREVLMYFFEKTDVIGNDGKPMLVSSGGQYQVVALNKLTLSMT